MKKVLTFVTLAIASAPALADVNPPMPQPPERLSEALAIIAAMAITAFAMTRRRQQG
jgi:hypothetical protein